MSDRFEDLLLRGAARLDLDLSPEGIAQLVIHRDLLRRWAAKVNLTTVLDDRGMAERLYLDSALVAKFLEPEASLHDVGSGAGFPGLVLKVLLPELSVTLTEARRKRVSFLKQAAREMGLGPGLDIRWQRLGWGSDQPSPDGPEETWQEVISRASFPPEIWLEAGAGLVAVGGRLWIMAGQPHGPPDQPPDLALSIPVAEFELDRSVRYQLPFCGLQRWLIGLRRTA